MDNTIPQAQGIPRLTVLVHICYTLTGTLYPPPGAPPAGSKPRPAEKPGKPENNTQATTPAPEGPRGNNTSPRRTSGSNPQYGEQHKQHKENTDKYANAMQGIKATTESREQKDFNNSSTARSGQRNNQFVATGILSTWELPAHLQYTIPDANNQLHLLLLTHEMWELPTPLIAANKPSREIEVRELPAQPPRYMGTTRSSLNIASCTEHTHSQAYNPCSILSCKQAHIRTSSLLSYNYNKKLATMTQIHHPKKLGAKSDAYANRLHKGDVFAHLTSFKQTFNNIQTKRLSKRIPTLPLSPSSELPTAGNLRR
ncbi:hypothetical protein F511_18723 [Dorcoceras hygrometricum]|uniref:Uncharacterized protein n=1 Tax=Dorcoceras hygrometricum TaxID=472368 RepID=A0A2Z7ALB0_9LAMI|nr:hypothetical protein F511_18723 [Dorcoceras hygrometricum]